MNLFSQAIISGLMTGAVYTSLGVGLVLVYRTARILNLAHGEAFAITGVLAAILTASGSDRPPAVKIAAMTPVMANASPCARLRMRAVR